MNKIRTFFVKMKKKLYLAVKRYPVAVVLVLLAAIMLMVSIDINSNGKALDDEVFIRLAMAALYGAVLSMVIKSAAERFGFNRLTEWLLYVLTPAAAALVFFFLITEFDSFEIMVKYALLCVLTASLFFFIPFIKSEKSASYFAQKVFLRLAVTMIYYGIVLGGVEAIIFAVENLLSVNMPDEIYLQTAVCLAGLFIPAFFFAGIPQKDDTQESYPRLLKILLHYIVFPLLAAYSAVLYAYFIKILLQWQLPSNLLGNLVIYYSLISVAALYFGHFTKSESRWTRLFNAVFPYILILPTLMMLLSFIIRIQAYGFTEPRYYAILCVIFVLRSISIIKLQKKVRIIPLTMSILLLVSIFGPFSSFNVSKWSQNRRFESILSQSGMLKDGEIRPNPDADDDTKHEISQIVSYFDRNHSTDDLKFTDGEFDIFEMEDIFGFGSFHIYKYPEGERYFIRGDYDRSRITEIAGYDYIAEIYSYGDILEFESEERNLSITTEETSPYSLVISSDGQEIYKTELLDILMPMFEDSGGTEEEAAEYVFTDGTDGISLKMVIMSAEYQQERETLYYDIKLLFSIK